MSAVLIDQGNLYAGDLATNPTACRLLTTQSRLIFIVLYGLEVHPFYGVQIADRIDQTDTVRPDSS